MKESSKKNSPRKNETEGNLVSALGVRDLEKPDTTGQLLEIIWRPQGDSNPCRRRERRVTACSIDATFPNLLVHSANKMSEMNNSRDNLVSGLVSR